eukprot:215830_1
MATEKTVSYNDKIKAKDKLTVNGYIRRDEQNMFSSNNESSYNNIPVIINYLCIKYYHISKDKFHLILHGTNINVSDNKITMTSWQPSSAFLSNIVSNHKHQWRFQIVNKRPVYIGVRANKTDPNNNDLNSLHYPCGQQSKNGSFGINLYNDQLRGDPQRYYE